MISVNSVSVYPKSISLKVGNWSYAAYAEVSPSNADCKEVQWHSDNSSVASVNASNGYICANGVGTAHIYATATDGSGCSDYLTVTVGNTVPVTSVTLNRSALSLEEGQSTSLSATVCPDNATNKNVNWTSSNNNVVTVSNGVVTAVSKGSARITATAADDSGKSASCTVTVTEDILVTSIAITPSYTLLRVGGAIYPLVTVCPNNATRKSVTWSSANSNIASVNPNSGLIYAKAAGTTTIYVTACDGSGVYGCCTVNVIPIYVQDIVVCPKTLTIEIGESSCLEATVYPFNATNPEIRWRSGDCNIADVDSNGCVTAKSTGTTYICAEATDDSGIRDCCEVTVNVPVVEDTVPGLKTIKQCRVRKDMSMDDSAILKDSSGTNVKLNVGDTVPLFSPSTISANDRVWYRILYKGMLLHVTADDESFEETAVPVPETPIAPSVTVNTGGVNLNIRCNPSTSYTELGQFSNGTTVVLTNEIPQTDTNGTNWYAVYGQATNGTYMYGWCSGEYLGNYIEYGTLVDTDYLTVRSGVGYNYADLGKIYKGDTVIILDRNCGTANGYPWHKILYNGEEVYVVAGNTPNFTFETRWIALTTTTNDNHENIDVSTLTPVSGNRHLIQSEMENNALIIYDYLRNKIETPWSKNAICALLGNMQAESTINPGRWQSGVGPGYGLVQWDPASKWLEWATTNNYAENSLFGQLRKILNEVEMDGVGVWDDSVHQWQKSRVNPKISFKNFTQSNKSVNELSTIFLKCYERPKDQSAAVISYRQELCTNWLNYINSFNLE